MPKPPISKEAGRYFLTDRIRDEVDWGRTPQAQGVLPPPVQKAVPAGAIPIPLPGPQAWRIPPCELTAAIARRESHRRFLPLPLRLDELAFLLWSTQGVRAHLHAAAVLRTVPSAGCRHPFETYLVVERVDELAPGLYRYLPLDHALLVERTPDHLAARLAAACRGQRFAAEAAVTFLWTVPLPPAPSGATPRPPTRSSPSTPDISARTSTSPARPSAPAPAPSPPTTRTGPTDCWVWTARRNSASTSRRWER